jgi:hypothetical protein
MVLVSLIEWPSRVGMYEVIVHMPTAATAVLFPIGLSLLADASRNGECPRFLARHQYVIDSSVLM